MTISNKNVGVNIASLRQKREMTQQQLASTLGVSHQAVSKWETGTALPDLEALLNISRLFGVTMEYLLTHKAEVATDDKDNTEYMGVQQMLDGFGENAEQAAQTIKDIGRILFKKIDKVINRDDEPILDKEEPREEDDGTFTSSISDVSKTTVKEKNDEIDEVTSDTSYSKRQINPEALLQLAPFMSREKVSSLILDYDGEITTDLLKRFAPFLTQEALAKLLSGMDDEQINPEEIMSLAPFLKQDMLFKLIIKNINKLDFMTLKKLAPFLKKGMVDMLVDLSGGIEKAFCAETISTIADKALGSAKNLFGKITEDACVAQHDNAEIKREFVDGQKVNIDTERDGTNINRDEKPTHGPVLAREKEPNETDKRFINALNSRSWDWLRQNLNSIGNGDLLESIVMAAATELPTEEARDILLNAAPYMETGNFKAVIKKLCTAGHWTLVCDLASLSDADDAGDILILASKSGKSALNAVRLFAPKAPKSVWNKVSQKAIDDGAWELVNALTESMPSQ